MSASTGFGTAAETPGNLPPPEPTALLPEATATGRARKLRFPRSPKILIGLGTLIVFIVIAVIGPWIAPYDPSASVTTTNGVPQPPSAAHWLGTTQVQQDVFSQLLAGGRSTLLVAFLAGIVATILSVLLGVTAGYLGGLSDDLLSMLANFFLVLPALPLLIVIAGFLPSVGSGNDLLIGLIIAVTGWAWGARVLRAQTLSLRSRDYVESARITGERAWRIIGFEILPNLTPIVASSFLFTVLYGVGTYTAMAFLGLISPDPLELGRHAVRGPAAAGGGQRLVVVVHTAGPGRGLSGHRAGAAQLRHRRVHQPTAPGGGPDPAAGQASGRHRRPCPAGSRWASPRSCAHRKGAHDDSPAGDRGAARGLRVRRGRRARRGRGRPGGASRRGAWAGR